MALATLTTFLTGSINRFVTPFYYYDPFAASPIGSNYDSTGANTTGRVTVVAKGNWSQQTSLLRTEVQSIELVEVE